MQKLMPTLTPRLYRGMLPATNPNHRAVIFKPSGATRGTDTYTSTA
jgi:hypothetical protein